MNTHVYMHSMPMGSVARVMYQVPVDPKDAYADDGLRWTTLEEEELGWEIPGGFPRDVAPVLQEFWDRFKALVVERMGQVVLPDGSIVVVCWRMPPAIMGSKDLACVSGWFSLWIGSASTLNGSATVQGLAGGFPAFVEEFTIVPFTWGPQERLDRYDVVYHGEIEP